MAIKQDLTVTDARVGSTRPRCLPEGPAESLATHAKKVSTSWAPRCGAGGALLVAVVDMTYVSGASLSH